MSDMKCDLPLKVCDLFSSDCDRCTVGKLVDENRSLRISANTGYSDLLEVGRLCGQTDSEYPLQAVQRFVADSEKVREQLKQVRRAALEEAAKAVENTEVVVHGQYTVLPFDDARATLANAAAAVRALSAKEVKS